MWIKKSTYNEMLDLINQQRKEIEKLQNRIDFLLNRRILKEMYFDIDFPNSTKGGFEGSDIFTM